MRYGVVIGLLLLTCCGLMSCSEVRPGDASGQMDSIFTQALSWQYRNIDSLQSNALKLYYQAESNHDDDRRAEALLLMAMYSFQQMDFERAIALSNQILQTTRNQIERLGAEIMLMRISQRTGDNRAFFVHRGNAERYLRRIAEEANTLTPHQLQLYNRHSADFHIVSSTYFYYTDQSERSLNEIRAAEPFCQLDMDTTSWLYYCYMRGSGGLAEHTTFEEITIEEFDYLFKCLSMAKSQSYPFFYANSLQAMATMFADSAKVAIINDNYGDAVNYLTSLFATSALLSDNTSVASQMAFDALCMFVTYDDLFQSACAFRTLGEVRFSEGHYANAIECYGQALNLVNKHHQRYYGQRYLLAPYIPSADSISVERRWLQDPRVKTVPEWIAGIRQQLSIAYSAIGNKPASDYNRNIYLDLLEETLQDMESEVVIEELQAESRELYWRLVTLAALTVGLLLLVLLLIRIWRKQERLQLRRLRRSAYELLNQAQAYQASITEEQKELEEEQQATVMRIERIKRQNIEKHAKLQLLNSMVPLLDRIIHEATRMLRSGEAKASSLEYIDELVECINQYNALLTDWIQMEQGMLSLQLTTFQVEPLFESMRKSHHAYEQKGLRLEVPPTELTVKADRALTLFMLNTLAENARKFTPAGGQVSITATAGEAVEGQYVELAVEDTGNGMDSSTIETILNQKVFSPHLHPAGNNAEGEGKGFGFGLMNCKGIIEKYRKTNPLFNVCCFGIESQIGKGSRFYFRLPRVVTALMLALMAITGLSAQTEQQLADEAVRQVENVYYSNIDGDYSGSIAHADSAINTLNTLHRINYPDANSQMTLDAVPHAVKSMLMTAEYEWALSGEQMDYELILALRNEIAVAALALNDWTLYRNNNVAYTRLYKWYHTDFTLESFGQQMQQSHTNQRIAMVMMVLIIIMAGLATWFLYILPRMRYRKAVMSLRRQHYDRMLQAQEQRSESQRDRLELVADEHQRSLYEENRLHVQNQIIDNCLSTIKHETMYYPGRIQRLTARLKDLTADCGNAKQRSEYIQTLSETIAYYKEVYTILCAQAAEQASSVNFHRERLTAQPLLDYAARRMKQRVKKLHIDVALTTDNLSGDASFRGDSKALELLVDSILDAQLSDYVQTDAATVSEWQLSSSISDDNRFVVFALHVSTSHLTEQQLHDLFTPHPGGTPYLIAKQVIREHDSALGHIGCRIDAIADKEGIILRWTLPIMKTT